jgi:hypothetical protein
MQLPTILLLIVLTSAAVVAVVFFVRLSIQLRRTAGEAEKTLSDVRVLVKNLNELDLEVKALVNEAGNSIGVFGKAAVGLSEAALLFALKLFPFPAKFLMFVLPAACLVARQIKKGKEKHYVE